MIKIINSITVEIAIKTGATSYSIFDNTLQNRLIHAVQIPRKGNRTRNANDSADLASDTTIDSGYLTLMSKENIKIMEAMPLSELTISADQPILKELMCPSEIRGDSTQIKISSAQAAADNGKILQVIFYFSEK